MCNDLETRQPVPPQPVAQGGVRGALFTLSLEGSVIFVGSPLTLYKPHFQNTRLKLLWNPHFCLTIYDNPTKITGKCMFSTD